MEGLLKFIVIVFFLYCIGAMGTKGELRIQKAVKKFTGLFRSNDNTDSRRRI